MRPLHAGLRRAVHQTAWFALGLAVLLTGGTALADGATVFLAGPTNAVIAGERTSIWLHFLNTTSRRITLTVPPRVDILFNAGIPSLTATAELSSPTDPPLSLVRGAFVRREYTLMVPAGIEGPATVSAPSIGTAAAAVLVSLPPKAGPSPIEPVEQRQTLEALEKSKTPGKLDYDPIEFFKRHFSGYEPFYFIAGPDSPNAKFQFSFKYQVLNEDGVLAQHAPALTGVHFAFTQTSLWDWNKPSAPFLDSSYKPELFYWMNVVDRGAWADWFRFDVQGGVQHESNGRDGTSSRSLNMLYFKSGLSFGPQNGLQLTLAPRAWVYLPDLYDNQDLPRYRGYADLRAILGWADGLQLASMLRIGDEADRASLTLDLTYPMSRLLKRRFSLYLHAQYFTGCDESFLLYRERSSAFRVGFTLFR